MDLFECLVPVILLTNHTIAIHVPNLAAPNKLSNNSNIQIADDRVL